MQHGHRWIKSNITFPKEFILCDSIGLVKNGHWERIFLKDSLFVGTVGSKMRVENITSLSWSNFYCESREAVSKCTMDIRYGDSHFQQSLEICRFYHRPLLSFSSSFLLLDPPSMNFLPSWFISIVLIVQPEELVIESYVDRVTESKVWR